jgi:hypothetical protein
VNALFALALLVSPLRAGVVMPVESGVAPAGPSAPVVPVVAPGGASLGSPSLGSAADLRGAIPVLPAPVPGLLGPVRHFVGEAVEAAAAIRPEAGAVSHAPSRGTAVPGRAADWTPALPAKASPGSPSLAISRDRAAAAAGLANGASLSRDRREAAPSNPLADSSALEHARPEKAAGLGRKFFDQSAENDRGALEDPSSSLDPAPVIAATVPEGGVFGAGRSAGRLSAPSAEDAFGPGHGPARSAVAYAPEGETLQDAVASVPGAAAAGGVSAVMFRSAAPNGELARGRAAEPSAAAGLPVLGAPRPLALDRAGLIVRVRSAPGAAIEPAAFPAAAPRPAVPGPSTAILERGAMLEAFSVAGDYAARAAAEAVSRPLAYGASRQSASLVPVPETTTAPLWWAWFFLPLFVAAVRGIL